MENKNRCQSCGILMEDASLYGKNADGTSNREYCCYCFANGAFENPNETLDEMIESCIPYLVEDGTCADEAAARVMLKEHMPHLNRWKKQGLIITFKLKDGVSADDLLAASDAIQEEYLSKCKGFIARQLMIINGVWTDWVIWETMADAENAMHRSEASEAAMKFMSMIGEVVEQGIYPLERSY